MRAEERGDRRRKERRAAQHCLAEQDMCPGRPRPRDRRREHDQRDRADREPSTRAHDGVTAAFRVNRRTVSRRRRHRSCVSIGGLRARLLRGLVGR